MGKVQSSSWESNFNPRDERHWSFARDSRGHGLNYDWMTVDEFDFEYHPTKSEKKSSVGPIVLMIVLAVVLLVLT